MECSIPPIAVLSVPFENDSLPVLTTKLSSFLYVLYTGHSIAAATGFVPNISSNATPESRAVNGMTQSEQQYFAAWKESSLLALPAIDWDTDRGHTPVSQRPLKRAQRRAEALNRIYDTNRFEPSHYTHFTQNHPLWLPLVTAVARVIGAERNSKETSTNLLAKDCEFQTLKSIVQTSLQIISQADDDSMKVQAQEKIRFLQATMRRLRPEQRDQGSCLGKRRYSSEHSPCDRDLMDSSVAVSASQVRSRPYSTGDNLVWKAKPI